MTIAGYSWQLLTTTKSACGPQWFLFERESPQIFRKLKKINSLKFAVNSWQFTFTPTVRLRTSVICMTSVDKILYCVFMITDLSDLTDA